MGGLVAEKQEGSMAALVCCNVICYPICYVMKNEAFSFK